MLLQGSCLDAYPKLSGVDFIFTDPPYGHNNNANGDLIQRREHALKDQSKTNTDERPILHDDFDTANQLFTDSIEAWPDLLVPSGYCCCCCGGGGGHKGNQFARWSKQLRQQDQFQFEQAIVFDKGPIGMGWHYRRSYEFILVAMRKGGKPHWYDESRTVENIIRPGDYGIRKIIPGAKQHPTEKPVELAAHFIRRHTQPGDTVLDPFMGSGSTGVAALQLGRKFIGIELDPHWFQHSEKRLKYVLKHGHDLAPAKKRPAQSTEQLQQPGLWGDVRGK